MTVTEVDPLIGQVLSGRFQIVAPIGVGGMGRVYRALQQPLGREVALKVLNPHYDSAKDPGFERRFFLEASITSKLKHPNTITVHDYGRTDDGIYFIAMEFLEGKTLQRILSEEGRLAWPRALFVAGQIARSLREAHKMGLVHRDLKPANIMLLNGGSGGDTVKVLDFGLVKSFTPEAADDDVEMPSDAIEVVSAISEVAQVPEGLKPEDSPPGLTQAGVLLGSPLYMSPEQARGETDPRSDIYSLGVIMFQTMAGRPPFVSKESVDVIVKHLREKPPELETLVSGLPHDVNAMVMKCLEKDAANRFQSMDELLDAMRWATAGHGMSGAFADPRLSGIIPRVSVPRPPTRPPPFPLPKLPPLPTGRPAEATGKKRPWPRIGFILGVTSVVALGAVLGGALAWKAFDVPLPVENAPPIRMTPRPQAPAEVRFAIDSQPSGATVQRDGVEIGVTPMELKFPVLNEEPLQVKLTFLLEGFEPQTIEAQGRGGLVLVNPVLVKKPELSVPEDPKPAPKTAKKKTKAPPAGYKDDPY